jgi:hypothetical protein
MERYIGRAILAAAQLLEPKKRMTKTGVAVSSPKTIRTLTKFIDAVAKYSSITEDLKCYRGQRNASWQNVAGVFRTDLKELARNEKRAIRDLISVHPARVRA